MQSGDGIHILIVDDDRTTCLALSFLLESWGYTPHVVMLPEAALSLCQHVRFDCVLLDYRLGQAFGRDLLPQFAQLGTMRPRGVVLLSAQPESQFTPLLKAGQICAFVQKPARPSEIREAVDTCLACPPQRAAS